ncbi:protein FAM118A isoform X1 [Phodopus roborovskii]|uniref:protein FAM118A isoform X1 n=2 Tax=Phodopus roborovskii TaxID=109678 RepID=UPI0021E47291|nr:protein FAM118A isoform X1 [Phodopus roborovskii]XP_051045500.1 protein FAM118A isoform X1 [Phodopus roborovskii]
MRVLAAETSPDHPTQAETEPSEQEPATVGLSRAEFSPDSQMESVEKTTNRSEQKSRKFLKSLIRKQPQDLLLVIGTGVSAAVAPGIRALCSWRSCIEAVIEAAEQLEVLHPGDVAEFRRKVMKDRDLLVVAHDLIRKMSPRTGDTKPNFFQDCLMEVFDSLEQHIQNPVVLQSILSLMDRGTMVLTTNYDNLLEIFGQQQSKPMESLDLKDKTKVLQWARGHIKYGVLHIHGLYTDPCGMVLDPSGYKDVTQDPEVMEVLQNLYRTKSFLFVGCGETLRDQIFQALFLYSVPNKVDLEHYMVVLKENEDHFFKHQADMLLHGIKVVSYGDCFDLFPGYVQDLATQICKQRSPDAERVDSTTLLGKADLSFCSSDFCFHGLLVTIGNACQDCAKRKLEENGIEVTKKVRQSDTADDAGGS